MKSNKLKIAILGANDFQNPMILKAKEMGIETHVFAWECGDVGEKTADVFHPVSIADKEKVLEICVSEGINGITTCGSDFAVVCINYVAEKMGLPGNGIATTAQCTNKFVMRETLKCGGVPVPGFTKFSAGGNVSDVLKGLSCPLIVKPTDRSGSRAVHLVTNIDELEIALKDAVETSFSKEAIVEEYVLGPEYSCESVSQNGVHHTLAITKKFTSGAPYFVEIAHRQPCDIDESLLPGVIEQIHKALTVLGIKDSASHAEFRLQPNGMVQFMEIGARMGGGRIGSDLTMLSTGIDFLKATIQVALGQEVDLNRVHGQQAAGIKFFLSEEEIANFDPASVDGKVERVGIFDRNSVDVIPGVPARFGYYIYTKKGLI